MTELERQQLEEKQRNSPYNLEPVYYCKHCLSLLIVNSGEKEVSELPSCYCDECGSTDIGQTDIFTWEKMYKEKYKSVIEKEQENIFKYGRKK